MCLHMLASPPLPPFTYADDVHEAIHAVADLEEQVLTLPLGRGTEGGPDEPGDAGDEKQGAQDDGGYLHLLDHCQRNGLPLQTRQVRKEYSYRNVTSTLNTSQLKEKGK